MGLGDQVSMEEDWTTSFQGKRGPDDFSKVTRAHDDPRGSLVRKGRIGPPPLRMWVVMRSSHREPGLLMLQGEVEFVRGEWDEIWSHYDKINRCWGESEQLSRINFL